MSERARFGTFTIDLATAQLLRGTAEVRLAAQHAQLLALLVSNAGNLVSRDDIRAHLWRDRWAEFDLGINTGISALRAALGDNAASPVYIETIPRQGYRFIAPVTLIAPPPRQTAWRSVAAIAGGFLLGAFVVGGVEFIGHALWPTGSPAPRSDELHAILPGLPLPRLLFVLLAWSAGSIFGAWAAARIANQARVTHAVGVGLLMLMAVLFTLLSAPHPAWFWAAGLLLLVPATAGGIALERLTRTARAGMALPGT